MFEDVVKSLCYGCFYEIYKFDDNYWIFAREYLDYVFCKVNYKLDIMSPLLMDFYSKLPRGEREKMDKVTLQIVALKNNNI